MTPTWVAIAALVISAATFVYNWLTKRKDRREQADRDKAAEALRADEQRKLEARVEQEQQNLREQVDSLTQMVAPLREVAETLRLSTAQPDIAWEMEWARGARWLLWNRGTNAATNVRLENPKGVPNQLRCKPEDLARIPSLTSADVVIVSTDQMRVPAYITVMCDELPEPQTVALRR